jgi:glycosyltransferase 2 family protein
MSVEKTSAGRRALYVKAVVSAAILAWLLARADLGAAGERLAGAAPAWLAIGFAVKALTIPLASERWRAVARAAGGAMEFGVGLKLMAASLFLGQALPGAVGGDIVRGWMTHRQGLPASATVAALAADRILALVGVMIVLAFGLPRLIAASPDVAGPATAAACALTAVAAGAALWADKIPLPVALARWRPVAALRHATASMRRGEAPRLLGLALAYATAVHFCTVLAAVAYAHALDMPATFVDCLAVVPFSIIAAALPLSLAGWGVREGSMMAGFVLIGLPGDDGLLLSLLIGASVLLLSLPGAPVWLAWSGDKGVADRATKSRIAP